MTPDDALIFAGAVIVVLLWVLFMLVALRDDDF